MTDNVNVKFLASRTVYDADGKVEAAFHKGKTYPLPEASAHRWIRRGVAEVAIPEKKESAKK